MPAKIFSYELIRLAGYSKEAFAETVGTHTTRLSAYINSRSLPDLPRARRIAEGLKIPLDDLVFPAESKKRDYTMLIKESQKRRK